MLLAGGEYRSIAVASFTVLRFANIAPWCSTYIVGRSSVMPNTKKAKTRSAKVGSNGEVLGFSDDEVNAFCPKGAGRLETSGGE